MHLYSQIVTYLSWYSFWSDELKTYQRMASNWFWSGMRRAVTQYVQGCAVYQQAKSSSLKPAGLFNPLPILQLYGTKWRWTSLKDLLSSGSVLVVVDRLTKYAHFLALEHPFTAQGVTLVFIREVVRLHGFPTTIVSDRDKIFLNLFWKELFKLQGTVLFKLQGTVLHHSTAYHSQSDGQTCSAP